LAPGIRLNFCPHCGHALHAGQDWPITCGSCRRIHYRNPISVGLAVIPVLNDEGKIAGVVGALRGKPEDAGYGRWGFPGGFQEWNENIATTAARETEEETALVFDPGLFRIIDTEIVSEGAHHLIFCLGPAISQSVLASASARAGGRMSRGSVAHAGYGCSVSRTSAGLA
jgi:ADP-ribose pyrophosphatase YjhB (NUDIX family)